MTEIEVALQLHKIAKKYIPSHHVDCVSGYIRNIQKDRKCKSIHFAEEIIHSITVNAFYFEAFVSMVKLILSSSNEQLQHEILNDMLRLLKPNDDLLLLNEKLVNFCEKSGIISYYINNVKKYKGEYFRKIMLFFTYIQIASSNDLILCKSNIHKFLMDTIQNTSSFELIFMCSFVLVEIAKREQCHGILLNDGILDSLTSHINKVSASSNFSLEMLQSSSTGALLLRLLSTYTALNEFHYRKLSIFCILLLKSMLIWNKLYFYEQDAEDSKFQVIKAMVNYDTIREIVHALYTITNNSESTCDYIVERLLPTLPNCTLLKELLSLMCYNDEPQVRIFMIQFCNNTLSRDNINSIDILIQNGVIDIFEKIVTQTKYKISNMEHVNILLCLGNLLCSNESHRALVLRNSILFTYILNCLAHFNCSSVVGSALYCVNNVLEMNDNRHSNYVLTFCNGKFINAIVCILNAIATNPRMAGYGIDSYGIQSVSNIVMESLNNIVVVIQGDCKGMIIYTNI